MLRRAATVLFTVTAIPMATKKVYAQGKDHHDGNGFKNPWPSFVSYGFGAAFKMMTQSKSGVLFQEAKPTDKPERVDIDWNLLKGRYENVDHEIHATWLGQ